MGDYWDKLNDGLQYILFIVVYVLSNKKKAQIETSDLVSVTNKGSNDDTTGTQYLQKVSVKKNGENIARIQGKFDEFKSNFDQDKAILWKRSDELRATVDSLNSLFVETKRQFEDFKINVDKDQVVLWARMDELRKTLEALNIVLIETKVKFEEFSKRADNRNL